MFLACCTGCVLKAEKKEHKVEVDDDEVDHQLSLKAVFFLNTIKMSYLYTCRLRITRLSQGKVCIGHCAVRYLSLYHCTAYQRVRDDL